MTNGNDPWDKVAKYIDSLTDIAVDAAKEHVDRLGKLWNKMGNEGFGIDDVMDATQEVAGAVVHYTAKAYVETRALMLDLAK